MLSNVELRIKRFPEGGFAALFDAGVLTLTVASDFFHSPAIRLVIFVFAAGGVILELLRDGGCVENGSRLPMLDFMEALLLERCGTVGVLGDR